MATELKPIRTKRDYEAALSEVERLWGATMVYMPLLEETGYAEMRIEPLPAVRLIPVGWNNWTADNSGMTPRLSPANLGPGRELMHPTGVIVVVAGAAVCGYWAWRQTTRSLYYRSMHSTIRPPDVTEEDYDRSVIVRRKRWRLAKSALSAGLGAAVAWVLFIMIDSGLRHQ